MCSYACTYPVLCVYVYVYICLFSRISATTSLYVWMQAYLSLKAYIYLYFSWDLYMGGYTSLCVYVRLRMLISSPLCVCVFINAWPPQCLCICMCVSLSLCVHIPVFLLACVCPSAISRVYVCPLPCPLVRLYCDRVWKFGSRFKSWCQVLSTRSSQDKIESA